MSDSEQYEYISVFGLHIYCGSMIQVIRRVAEWMQQHRRAYICVTGVHGIVESQRSLSVYRAHAEATLVVPDGMPLVWLAKLFDHKKIERIYGPDLFLALCKAAERLRWRIFLYGTTADTLNKLSTRLKLNYPKLRITGSYAPPFRLLSLKEKKALTLRINNTRPHIVFVGLSTPKQELWMHEFSKRLHPTILIGVGAAFDFISGTKRQAPVWMQKSGLEWLFRLVSEPRRLFMRYIINNTLFLHYLFVPRVRRINS